jgi:hypothetical protein
VANVLETQMRVVEFVAASPVLPTPVGPTNTRFSCLATKSSSAKARTCLRLTPGCRAYGNVSSDQRSGRFLRLLER